MNILSDSSKYQDLSEESRIEQHRHAEVLRQYEIKKRARNINVPTAPEDVKRSLRDFGHPATLFGEDHADRRERLREVIAAMQLNGEESAKVQAFLEKENAAAITTEDGSATAAAGSGKNTAPKEVFYSAAVETLIEIRKEIASDSFDRAKFRLQYMRELVTDPEATLQDREHVYSVYQHSKDLVLNLSQFGDDRPLTAVKYSPTGQYIATGSFGSEIKVWNTSNLDCQHTFYGHSDRVTSIAWQSSSTVSTHPVFASTSSDGHVIVWDGRRFLNNSNQQSQTQQFTNNNSMDIDSDDDDEANIGERTQAAAAASSSSSEFLSTLQQNRLPSYHHKIKVNENAAIVSSCAFHPHFPQLLAASCHDYSWRLYDVDHAKSDSSSSTPTATELLLQDGHVKECSAVAFHPDGSLVMTGDAGGVSLLWDIRSGQMIQGFSGHVKKISSISFHPNGFQVATGSLDNTVKVWDLRKKKAFYTIPAHSNLIADCTYSVSGELLVTASFDGTLKLFGSRDFRHLRTLTGHNGKVMACDIAPDEKHVMSVGYDRTIKLWAHKSEF